MKFIVNCYAGWANSAIHCNRPVLISSEKPVGWAAKEGRTSLVRSPQLTGLAFAEAEQLVKLQSG